MSIVAVYLDQWLVVLDKPPGLLSVPGIGPEKADCLAVRAAKAYPGARIVHRLDQATSGLIVMARDAESHRRLSRQFEHRKIGKVYIAVAAGHPEHDAGSIELPIRTDIDNRPHQIVDYEHGKSALTHWRVLNRNTDTTRFELRPHTGRSHQLRVHLKEIGHPILGDDLYAPEPIRAASDRLLLHATELSFDHPIAACPLAFHVPCPF